MVVMLLVQYLNICENEILLTQGAVRCNIVIDAKSAMPSAPLDPEEATLSPAWAPAVLDDPEVATALRAVADGCNRMVVFLPVPKKPFQSKISTHFFTRNVPAVRVSRLLAAARVLEDAVAVVEQVVSLWNNCRKIVSW